MKTVGNLMVKNSLHDFVAKEMYLHLRNRFVSFHKRRKMFCFNHFQCSYDAVSELCKLELLFQTFSDSTVFEKSAGKKCAVFV